MVKLISKVVYLDYKNTCIRLCDKEWYALDDICKEENIKRKELINRIKFHKNHKLGLTPAIRLFTLLYYKDRFKNSKINNDNNISSLLSDIS